MLNHRTITLLFFLFLTILFLLDVKYEVHWSIFAALILLYVFIEFYGAAYLSSNFHIKAYCKGTTTRKFISLTFDDGPYEETLKVLDVLREESVPATFFCIGKNIPGNEKTLQRMHSEGHIIGNHSDSHHFLFDLKTKGMFVTDLLKTEKKIHDIIGEKPLFFRPPYGVATPALSKAVKKLGYRVVGWSIRSLDTKIKNKRELLTRIKNQAGPGSLILMHDNLPGTDLVVKDLIRQLKQDGFTFIGLEDLINKKAYA